MLSDARHLDERTVLVKTADAAYRLDLAGSCPRNHEDQLVALAPNGWVCGGRNEFIRAGDRLCAIKRITPIDERGWALALREQAQKDGIQTLATVTVEGKASRRRGFAASPEYCLDPRRVRGWNVSGRDIVVNTQPRRGSKEASTYRLEFGRACPEASLGSQLNLVSGVGIGWVCGNPGDLAMISKGWEAAPGSPGIRNVTLGSGFALRGCPIVAVYAEH